MSTDEWINTVVSALMFSSAAVFVVTYHLMAPWRSTPMGWHLMLFAGAIGGLGAYTVAIAIVGQDGFGAAALRYARALFLLVMVGLMVQRTVMVIRVQRHDSKDDDE
ncbi:putative phage holin [Streptomyces platensis]|uniref:putative phage holin n=1 Tax=Streptomyces platensis TaxID=58346 RepID=UPI0033226EEF